MAFGQWLKGALGLGPTAAERAEEEAYLEADRRRASIDRAQQDARYQAFVKAGPVPVLKDLGFKKKGLVWTRDSEEIRAKVRLHRNLNGLAAETQIDIWVRRPREFWTALMLPEKARTKCWPPARDEFFDRAIIMSRAADARLYRDVIPAVYGARAEAGERAQDWADVCALGSDYGLLLGPLAPVPRHWPDSERHKEHRRLVEDIDTTPEEAAAVWRDHWAMLMADSLEDQEQFAVLTMAQIALEGEAKENETYEGNEHWQMMRMTSRKHQLWRSVLCHFANLHAERDRILRFYVDNPPLSDDQVAVGCKIRNDEIVSDPHQPPHQREEMRAYLPVAIRDHIQRQKDGIALTDKLITALGLDHLRNQGP